MNASKFGIGQQVRHSLLGCPGVVVDIDPEYSLDEPLKDELADNADVVMEDGEGKTVHCGQSPMDELAYSIRRQLQAPRLRN